MIKTNFQMYFNQSLNLISHNDNPIIRIADDGAIIDAKPNVVCKIIAIWLTLSANDDFKYAPIKLTVYWYSTVKPFLKLIFLPVTVITTGIFYPFINVIILKLASLIMGDTFVVEGWILPFFIALFISFTTLILDKLITKNVIGE